MKPIKLIEYLLGNFIGDIISFLLTVGHKPLKNCQETANFHVKDRELGGSTVPLGDGAADFTAIFNLIKDLDYKGNLIMQTARSSEGKHAEVLIEYRNMILRWMEDSFDAT